MVDPCSARASPGTKGNSLLNLGFHEKSDIFARGSHPCESNILHQRQAHLEDNLALEESIHPTEPLASPCPLKPAALSSEFTGTKTGHAKNNATCLVPKSGLGRLHAPMRAGVHNELRDSPSDER